MSTKKTSDEINKIGILGGGQLAKMLAESCAGEDLSFISADVAGSCAFKVTKPFTKDLSLGENLDEFCELVDVVTFDSEHLGVEFANGIIKRELDVFPDYRFVQLSGDRFKEKTELNRLGISTAPFIKIDKNLNSDEISKLIINTLSSKNLSDSGIVIKTRHGGYDGKGQWVLKNGILDSEIKNLAIELSKLNSNPGLIIEGLINFGFECSIIASRSLNGEFITWPLIHNIHKDSILDISRCPINKETLNYADEKNAQKIVKTICEEHNYVGTICVELFCTDTGLIVNEIAPRVHNSGHLTIEGSVTSQFKNHINAIRGQELGPSDIIGSCAMINIVGYRPNDEALNYFEETKCVYFHWYNKEVRPKRKVGHITIVAENDLELESKIDHINMLLGIRN
ncbi:MAG: 5-(carboxyamino)imidazole ribonucleotide synthase [Acidimicrobiia bacterium]|nr:5-(carboxyamino)imidazole ribonucleotide synthase [Acidimicrobiia bacterium]